MKPRRIAMVSFSPLAVGGIETHMLQIFRGLAGEFEFVVFGVMLEPFVTQARECGVSCVPLPPAGKANPAALFRLRNEFLTREIALVHTHDTRGGLIGRLAARSVGKEAVHTVHTPSFFLPGNPAVVGLYRRIERWLNRRASNKVIFVSHTIQQMYLDGGLVSLEKARHIPNGLESEWFEPVPRKERGDGEVRFLYVGRLAREKGMGNLAAAFDIVAGRLPGARLQAAGEGPTRDDLIRAAERGGWATHLALPGRISREEARNLMRASDIFVLPSWFESFSYTLLEAMACGLPCVATDVGGNRDLIDPERTGCLVPRNDPPALAAIMMRFAEDLEMRLSMGRGGYERAREYTLDRMITGTRSVYLEVLDKSP